FRSGGIAMVSATRTDFAGLTPGKVDMLELAVWVREQMAKEGAATYESDRLGREDSRWQPISEVASGVAALRVGDPDDTLFMIFRPEMVSTIQWGGDPRKTQT